MIIFTHFHNMNMIRFFQERGQLHQLMGEFSSPKEFHQIFAALDARFGDLADCEVTVEMDPGTFSGADWSNGLVEWD